MRLLDVLFESQPETDDTLRTHMTICCARGSLTRLPLDVDRWDRLAEVAVYVFHRKGRSLVCKPQASFLTALYQLAINTPHSQVGP